MTHQQKLEAVRQACIKANPEIVELKFGCEFRAGTSTMLYTDTESYAVNNIGFLRAHFCSKEYPRNAWEGERRESPTSMHSGKDIESLLKESISASKAFSNTYPSVEIIGRPIRLSDVILALRTSNIHEDDWKEELCRLTNKWDARKDSLGEQSEETISFLYELLK